MSFERTLSDPAGMTSRTPGCIADSRARRSAAGAAAGRASGVVASRSAQPDWMCSVNAVEVGVVERLVVLCVLVLCAVVLCVVVLCVVVGSLMPAILPPRGRAWAPRLRQPRAGRGLRSA
ncbi:hypothetical protein GCM10009640_00450 [Agrococcus citreus]|uniref:Uncharacterized protein n=1 Tax=Agrococcus citreus TaxID=84643 RepID=A0ABN1YMX9_9MICO